MNRKKGIVGIDDAIVIGVIVAVGALAVWFAGPSAAKTVSGIFGGTKNQAKQVYRVEESRTPFYQDEKGRFIPAPKQDSRKEYRENVLSTEPPLTWWQKYGGYLVLLGIIIVAFPSFGVWITTKARSNLSQLVTGIQNANDKLPKTSQDIVLASLSSAMDGKLKKQVRAVKADLVKKDVIKITPVSSTPQ